jgi:hypothetical protein
MPLMEDTMIRAKSRLVALGMGLGLLVAWAGGCEDEDDLPELNILSPNAGTTHDLGESMRVRFSFETDDFEIEQDCGAEVQCGMAFLNIDGGACNQPGRDYNNVLLDADVGENRSMEALFDQCPVESRVGSHSVTISLRYQDGSQVIGEGGQPVAATITINTAP